VKKKLPSYITPSSRNGRRHPRHQRRRRLPLFIGIIVLFVAVVAWGLSLPLSPKTAASTSTSTAQAPTASTSSTTLRALTTTSTAAAPPKPTTLSAQLTGEDEIPAVSTPARGTLTLTLAADGSSVAYVLNVSAITNLTVARLHEGQAGASGATILTIYAGASKSGLFSGTLTQGSFTAAKLEGPLKGKTIADFLALAKAGSVYLNVGTTSHLLGEIRGQLK
jgi:hypothetical protein